MSALPSSPATVQFQPIAARPAPVRTQGLVPWARANLFGNWMSTLTTFLLLGLFLWWLPGLLNWVVIKAVFVPSHE